MRIKPLNLIKFNTISIKYPAFVSIIVLISVLLVGIISYHFAYQGLIRASINSLNTIASQSSTQYQTLLKNIEHHVTFLSLVPPTNGILRAQQNNGVDPVSNSSEVQWRNRLKTIFNALLKTNTDFQRIRYITAPQQPTVLVSSTRNYLDIKSTIKNRKVTLKNELRHLYKSTQLRDGELYISNVFSVQNTQPTIIVITPIFYKNKLSGWMELNINLKNIFSSLRYTLDENYTLYITKTNNDFIYYPGSGLTFGSNKNQPNLFSKYFPNISKKISALRDKTLLNITQDKNSAFGLSPVYNKIDSPSPSMWMVITTPMSLIVKSIENTRDYIVLSAIFTLLIVLTASFLLTKKLVYRLKLLTDNVINYKKNNDSPIIDIGSNDEISELYKQILLMQANITYQTQELSDSEEVNRTLVETLVDAVITINEVGIVTTFNPGAEKMFLWKASEIIGENIKVLIPHPHFSKHDYYLKKHHDTKETYVIDETRELEAKRKDGSIFPIELSVTKMTLGNKAYFNGVIRDITERKDHEQQILAREKSLLRSNQELEKFAYIASHDLQEPLRKVQAFSDRLQTKYSSQLGETGQDYINRMTNAASRMRTLINDLLSFSRVSTEARPFEPVDLNQVLLDVLSDLEILIKETGAIVTHPTLPCIDADPLQIRQLFQNLIGNAIKFHQKDIKPKVDIMFKLEETTDIDGLYSEMCILTFKDNGIGFEEEFNDKIFDVFQRLHNRTEFEGTGVGLAICRKIVQRHGGVINAKAKLNEGATFTFSLRVQNKQDIE